MSELFQLAADITRAHARHSDPQPSHEAAAKISTVRITDLHAHIFSRFLVHGPMTDEELISRVEIQPRPSDSSIRSRRSELVAKGHLRSQSAITGVYGATSRGNRATIYEVQP